MPRLFSPSMRGKCSAAPRGSCSAPPRQAGQGAAALPAAPRGAAGARVVHAGLRLRVAHPQARPLRQACRRQRNRPRPVSSSPPQRRVAALARRRDAARLPRDSPAVPSCPRERPAADRGCAPRARLRPCRPCCQRPEWPIGPRPDGPQPCIKCRSVAQRGPAVQARQAGPA